MTIKLEIRDSNQNLIEEDNLKITNGDILLVQVDQNIRPSEIDQIGKSIRRAFKERLEHPDRIAGIIIPENITLKILKVTKEIPNKDIEAPKYDTVDDGFGGPLG